MRFPCFNPGYGLSCGKVIILIETRLDCNFLFNNQADITIAEHVKAVLTGLNSTYTP